MGSASERLLARPAGPAAGLAFCRALRLVPAPVRPVGAEQRRRRLLEHPAPGRLRLALPLDLIQHMADAAGGDLYPVALGDRLVAIVVAGQLHVVRLEAVLGDLEP